MTTVKLQQVLDEAGLQLTDGVHVLIVVGPVDHSIDDPAGVAIAAAGCFVHEEVNGAIAWRLCREDTELVAALEANKDQLVAAFATWISNLDDLECPEDDPNQVW